MKYQGSSEKAKALGQKTSKALSSGLQIIFSTQSGDCSVERKLFFDILGPINAGVGGAECRTPRRKKRENQAAEALCMGRRSFLLTDSGRSAVSEGVLRFDRVYLLIPTHTHTCTHSCSSIVQRKHKDKEKLVSQGQKERSENVRASSSFSAQNHVTNGVVIPCCSSK